MLNQIVLMGRLVADPELRYTQAGQAVASFRLAVDRDFDREHRTDFLTCVAWNQTAEFAAKYFTKGSMAVVGGRLQIREWTDRNGNKKADPEIVVNNLYFGEAKAKGVQTEDGSAMHEIDDSDSVFPF